MEPQEARPDPQDSQELERLTAQALRQRAEGMLAQRPTASPLSEADRLRLLHELQVHQIELEMQNVALAQAQAETADSLHRLAALNEQLEQIVAERTADLVLARDAAEAASRAKSAFLSTMSHEIRTPLSGVMGLIRLARGEATQAKQIDRLDKADRVARHLLAVVNDVLDFAKMEALQLRLECIDFDLDEVLRDVLAVLADQASAKGIGLKVEVAPELAQQRLRGDPFRLTQVLLNLAGNAVKFTEQGAVTLRVARAGGAGAEHSVRFEVIDSGIGISAPNQQRLFAAFEQAEDATARQYGGTGLGLAISQRLVQLMGGEIGVRSQLGQGSTFWFSVGLAPAPAIANAPAPPAARAAADPLAGRRAAACVLVAEDDPINQEVMRANLEGLDLQVEVANDGAEALQMALAKPYAMIFMDMRMPVMNGLDAVRAIRRDPRGADVAILVTTANDQAQDRQACAEAGANEHLSKPVTTERLVQALERWLPQLPASSTH